MARNKPSARIRGLKLPSTSFSVQLETANALDDFIKSQNLQSRTDGIKFLLEKFNSSWLLFFYVYFPKLWYQ